MSTLAPSTVYYTDGSFKDELTSYSIVRQITGTQFETVNEAHLPDHTGIFTAEIAAIKMAIIYAIEHDERTLICTDSLSATKALLNGAYDDMLGLQNANQQVLVLWIPAHIGIQGNETADNGAKRALNLPQISETPCFPRALVNPFRFSQLQQNPTPNRPKYNRNLTRQQCVMMARLRVGKAVFNSKHYYQQTDPPKCSYCDVYLTIPHMLTECQISKIDEPLERILDCATNANLLKILRCLRQHSIQDV